MKNLIAEMARYGVSNTDIQNLLGCSEKTVRNKLNGDTAFYFQETTKIRETFFKGYRLEYLFAPDIEVSTRTDQREAS